MPYTIRNIREDNGGSILLRFSQNDTLSFSVDGTAWTEVKTQGGGGGGGGGVTSVNGDSGDVILSVNGQTTTSINLTASEVGALSINGGSINGNIDVVGLTASNVPDIVNVGNTFSPKVLGHYSSTVSNGEVIHIIAPTVGKTIFDYDLTVAGGSTSFSFDPPVYWTGLGGTVSFTPGSTQNLRLEYVGGTFQGGYREPSLSQYLKLNGINTLQYGFGNSWEIRIPSNYTKSLFNLYDATPNNTYFYIGGAIGGNTAQQVANIFITACNTLNLNCRDNKISWNNHLQNTKGGFCISDSTTGNITSPGDLIATISGSAVCMSDLAIIVVDGGSATSATIANLEGGKNYQYGELTNLTITAVTTSNKESIIEFTSGATATVLNSPSTLLWANGEAPTIEANTSYEINIRRNKAVCTAFKVAAV